MQLGKLIISYNEIDALIGEARMQAIVALQSVLLLCGLSVSSVSALASCIIVLGYFLSYKGAPSANDIGTEPDTSKLKCMLRTHLKHLGIIMDGNRRFGTLFSGEPNEGHRHGACKLIEMLEWCTELDIKFLSVFAFSTENWNRKAAEIEKLYEIIRTNLALFDSMLDTHRIKIRFLSTSPELIPQDLREKMDFIEKRSTAIHTCEFDELQLNVFVSYGGRQEIAHAMEKIMRKTHSDSHRIHIDATPDLIAENLLTHGNGGDPDLIIRTSGESRVSNFLLWQIAYSEIFIEQSLWPDLSKTRFISILRDFINRKRRFGK